MVVLYINFNICLIEFVLELFLKDIILNNNYISLSSIHNHKIVYMSNLLHVNKMQYVYETILFIGTKKALSQIGRGLGNAKLFLQNRKTY